MPVPLIAAKPVTGAGNTDLLPWATSGTTLEPTAALEGVGFQSQAVAGPPDYRPQNWRGLQGYAWWKRLTSAALFAERSQCELTVPDSVATMTHTLTLNGHASGTYTSAGGGTTADAAGIVAMLQADPVLAPLAIYEASAAHIYITWLDPGVVPTFAQGGTATALTVTSAFSTPIIRVDPAGLDALDVVIGSPTADHTTETARIVWRKGKAAFQAGAATGTQWDAANTGSNTINLGLNCQAGSDDGIAAGWASTISATGSDHCVAVGTSCTIGDNSDHSLCMGDACAVGSIAAAPGATCIGVAALVDATFGTALGKDAVVTSAGTHGLAVNGGTAGASQAQAIGVGASATGADSNALGTSANASAAGAIAEGNTATASAENAVAIGKKATASGIGSVALGGMDTVAGATGPAASGRGAVGIGHESTAAADYSMTRGPYCATAAAAKYGSAAGFQSSATNPGEEVYAAGAVSLTAGEAQCGRLHVAARTTNATPVSLDVAGTGTASWTLVDGMAYEVEIAVVARDEATGNRASWRFRAQVARQAGTSVVDYQSVFNGTGHAWVAPGGFGGLNDRVATSAGLATADCTLSASGAGGTVSVNATGIAATNIRWSARIDYIQVGGA